MKLNKLTLASIAMAGLAGTSSAAVVTLDLTANEATAGSAGLGQTFWDNFDLGGGLTADITITGVSGSAGAALDTIAAGYGVSSTASNEGNRMGPGETITFTFSDFSAPLASLEFIGFVSENNSGAWNIGATSSNNAVADTMLINGTSYAAGTFASAPTVTGMNFSSAVNGFVAQTLTSSVAANGSNAFEIGMSTGTARLAGLQFEAVAVPEPSSTALLGLGGLALILRRRK
ncbi:PEP-CTERM sorting domain-containing protein [Rubritalea sp.]|uniref:PEP-CTERM sorting domain-containing protein n=1 Tax=Rubritalea sp. TaxID=2109375 RepID=UPI003EF1CA2A